MLIALTLMWGFLKYVQMLRCALHGDWTSVKGLMGDCLFWPWTKKTSFSPTGRLIRMKFGIRRLGIETDSARLSKHRERDWGSNCDGLAVERPSGLVEKQLISSDACNSSQYETMTTIHVQYRA